MDAQPFLTARRYLDAAANMHAKQVIHRARRLLPMAILAAGTAQRSPTGWQPLALGAGVETAPSSGPRRPPHEGGAFRAFGVERSAHDPALWTEASGGLLFLFHLHGFQDLAQYASPASTSSDGHEFWSLVIMSWLGRCGAPTLPAWHPYPMSGRIIAWCAALSRDGLLDDVRERMLSSMRHQLRTLGRAVEHDIGGNHVVRNAAALIIGGVSLEDFAIAKRGERLLEAELAHQILSDGGHEERSPCYHRLVLDDLIDVATVLNRSKPGAPAWLTTTTERMRWWLGAVAGPAGEVPPLNDGWDGPPFALSRARPAVEVLTPSGYVALCDGSTRAVLDVAPVSPAHLPAHAHADVLSLVLWAAGEPVLIDLGSGAYSGPHRDKFRGTAAHNTVQVDGHDQCDLWGTFRAAGLPRVHLTAVDREEGGAVVVRARHDGYRRLADPVIHERSFVWLGTHGIVVLDRLLCKYPHDIVSRLHFAEGIEAPLTMKLPGGLRFSLLGSSTTSRQRPTTRSPFIGQTQPITVVEMPNRVHPGELFGWMLTGGGVEISLNGSQLEVVRPGKPLLRTTLLETSACGRLPAVGAHLPP